MMKQSKLLKKIAACATAAAIAAGSAVSAAALPSGAVTDTVGAGEFAVVNFAPKWGDVDANVQSMKAYIDQAAANGVKMLVFPEMAATGYASADDPSDPIYQMAVGEAETKDGPTATEISKLADEKDMWVLYGATETIPDDSEHAYNSTFACSPDGAVTTYQKITPVEGAWCTPGTTPVMLDTEWGKVGLSICYDTYATPELERYYAAEGCGIVINSTATSRSYSPQNDKGWEWYYKNRLESITSREGVLILSANLVGKDGPNGEYNFPGGSVILCEGTTYLAGADGTGPEADIITGKAGLVANDSQISLKWSPSGTCTVAADFHPDYYAKWYKELADKQKAGESLSYYSNVTDGPKAAVVNMVGKWGDKAANLETMKGYIDQAGAQDVDILVFPETVLAGYGYEADVLVDENGNPDPNGKVMQVAVAETIPGPSTNELSEYAKKYGMYIIFGMNQKTDTPMYEENGAGELVEKVYNSAAVLFPDGRIESYQKMHRAGVESEWSVCGSTPYMFETEWGKIGVDICRDGHFYPELGRYYAAMGCTMLIHPTATTGNPWYRESRIGSYTDRDGMAAITCNLLGEDGVRNPDGSFDTNSPSYCNFASTSLIITKYGANHGTSFNPETGRAIDLNGTGSDSEGYEQRRTSPAGLEVAKMNLKGCGFNIANFNPDLFSHMYDQLAVKYVAGYKSIYATTPDPDESSSSESGSPSSDVSTDESSAGSGDSSPSAEVSANASDPSSASNVQTGDTAPVVVAMVALLAAGSSVVLLKRRRNQ